MRIEFYDEEDIFGIYEIIPFKEMTKSDVVEDIKSVLEEYKEENRDSYNIDDFISILEKKGYKINDLHAEVRMYF